jgi:hypothetical protein
MKKQAMTPTAPSLAATVTKVGKFFRLNPDTLHQLESASKDFGIDQQQIVEDALVLYFNPKAPSPRAQRDALLTRIRLAQHPVKRV